MIKYFLNFVEIKTKLISVFSFFVALLFYVDYLMPAHKINTLNFFLFFASMLLIDMFTTALNHVSAYYKENVKGDYDKELIIEMKEKNYSIRTNITIIIVLAITYICVGLLLVYRSNIGVLLLGMLSVGVGILYSFGKKPISYTPLGEVFAGGTMGVILPVIVIFTQFDHLPFELNPLIAIVFLPLAFLIGNILFANNICDIEIDVSNNRYTLAYYTKEKLGTYLLHLSNVGALFVVLLASILGFVPIYFNILFVMVIPFTINVSKFSKAYCKQTSFPYILKNFVVFCLGYMLLYILDIVFNLL